MHATTLVLIRHARTEENGNPRLTGWYDAPLSVLGHAQIERLRSRLAGDARAGAVYASPLRRARETAQGAAPSEIRLELSDSLREIYCGVADGLPLSKVQANYPHAWRQNLAQTDENFRWPGGESYRDFRGRVLEAVNAIAARHPGHKVLIFTHAGVINQILGAVSGLSPARWEVNRPSNASISQVHWMDGSGEILCFDDRAHLL